MGSPSNVYFLTSAASGYFYAGQPNLAERLLVRVVASHPNDLSPRLNLGTILLGRRAWTEAAEHLEAALGIDPRCAEAMVNLAAAYVELGRLEDAETRLRTAIALGETRPIAYELLMRVRARKSRR